MFVFGRPNERVNMNMNKTVRVLKEIRVIFTSSIFFFIVRVGPTKAHTCTAPTNANKKETNVFYIYKSKRIGVREIIWKYELIFLK